MSDMLFNGVRKWPKCSYIWILYYCIKKNDSLLLKGSNVKVT